MRGACLRLLTSAFEKVRERGAKEKSPRNLSIPRARVEEGGRYDTVCPLLVSLRLTVIGQVGAPAA